MKISVTVFCILSQLKTCQTFIQFHRITYFRQLKAVAVPDVADLQYFDKDGTYLENTITNWLDNEYIQLDCHRRIGQRVKKVYMELREAGISDIGDILVNMGTSLESNVIEFEKAFVGPWDVANKVSDILLRLLGVAMCSCSDNTLIDGSDKSKPNNGISGNLQNISNSTATLLHLRGTNTLVPPAKLSPSKVMQQVQDISSSMFTRYNLLKQFLEAVPVGVTSDGNGCDVRFVDADAGWREMHVPIAMCLGFRLQGSEMVQQPDLAPRGWEGLTAVPDLSTIGSGFIYGTAHVDVSDVDAGTEAALLADLPEDEASMDPLLEQLAGAEMLRVMRKVTGGGQREASRRILIAKWLYIMGYLSSDFPHTTRWIPPHMEDEEGYL